MAYTGVPALLVILATNLVAALALLAILSRLIRRGDRGAQTGGAEAGSAQTGNAETGSARRAETSTLHTAADNAPMLIWIETPDGAIEWANIAYLGMLDSTGKGAARSGTVTGTGLPTLFAPAARAARPAPGATRRVSVERAGEAAKWWFEHQQIEQPDGRTLHFAQHANPVVRAEEALRNFVQTLTMTFAHLPTGLAIFDRKRQLALFNPALTDLTGVEPEWLSARPTLYAFLDRLHDRRMIPEPKDYKTWRQRMSAVERAAEDGTFEETWPLPGGQTYRVIGRPHPEGAVAFLIEDISAEISLRRRVREELELSQSVLDTLDEAVAVFSAAGRLVISNRAYALLWGDDPGAALDEIGIAEATSGWQARCAPSPVWGDLREFAMRPHDRAEWTADLRLNDGRALVGRFAPLAGGATLCAFEAVPAEEESSDPPGWPAARASGQA